MDINYTPQMIEALARCYRYILGDSWGAPDGHAAEDSTGNQPGAIAAQKGTEPNENELTESNNINNQPTIDNLTGENNNGNIHI